jgi:TetR/AcrR family transcriptional regulator
MIDLEVFDAAEGASSHRMKGDERRGQLTRVAIGLFARNGFNGTTTKMIAAAAGVTEALIFRYFPSKEALYEAILRWKVQESGTLEWIESMRAIAERREDEVLFRSLISRVIAFHRQNPDFQRLMLYAALEGHDLAKNFREQLVRPLHDFLTEYVTIRQQEGAFRDIDPNAAVRAAMAMPLHHALVTNLLQCEIVEISDEDAIEQFTRTILDGLRRSSGGSVEAEGER